MNAGPQLGGLLSSDSAVALKPIAMVVVIRGPGIVPVVPKKFMTKIFVSGISPQTDEIELAKLFLVYGQINTIEIVRDKHTNQSKGFGFVELHNDHAALEAVDNLDGAALGESKLLVKVADDKPKSLKQSFRAKPPNYIKVERAVAGQKRKRPRLSK